MCQLDYCVALSASCATLEPGDSRDSQGVPTFVRELKYYFGGHNKPLEERRNLELIVDEVMTGTTERPIDRLGEPERWFDTLSHAFKYLGPVILGFNSRMAWELSQHWQTFTLLGHIDIKRRGGS